MKSTDNKKSPHIYSAFVVYTHITLIVCAWLFILFLVISQPRQDRMKNQKISMFYGAIFLPVFFLWYCTSFIRTLATQKRTNSTLDSNICFGFDMLLRHCQQQQLVISRFLENIVRLELSTSSKQKIHGKNLHQINGTLFLFNAFFFLLSISMLHTE